MAASNVRYPKGKHTAQMTADELARVWAHENGLYASRGGWLYDGQTPVVQGYLELARILTRARVIEEGVGIHWAHVPGERVTPHQVRIMRRAAPFPT